AKWTATGPLNTARGMGHTATLLPNGKVLMTGGMTIAGYARSTELYDPATGTWTTTGAMTIPRGYHTATLLPSGKVLAVAGIYTVSTTNSAELYDPATARWTLT